MGKTVMTLAELAQRGYQPRELAPGNKPAREQLDFAPLRQVRFVVYQGVERTIMVFDNAEVWLPKNWRHDPLIEGLYYQAYSDRNADGTFGAFHLVPDPDGRIEVDESAFEELPF